MDDGRLSVFRWLSRASTGLATQTFSTDYHGPGRGAGHSLAALLVGLQLTGDATLLGKSEEIIRRVVHPCDDIASRNLLNAERRWSYTAFFQALGRYLMVKAERGEFDRMYAYARASMLHYSRWMADNEYPYLDKPDMLEFPTETWAAQDLRKSDVFYLAASVADGNERARFVERGAFFAEHSLKTLAAMPTRRLTRPVVLMLSHGWLHHVWARKGNEPQPVVDLPTFDGPPARPFVPQRTTAIRRASALAIGGALSVLAALGWWLIE
jgi:hypothetical protein